MKKQKHRFFNRIAGLTIATLVMAFLFSFCGVHDIVQAQEAHDSKTSIHLDDTHCQDNTTSHSLAASQINSDGSFVKKLFLPAITVPQFNFSSTSNLTLLPPAPLARGAPLAPQPITVLRC